MASSSGSKFGISRGLVAALVASLLVLVSPPNVESKADYTSFLPGAITYNDRVCNLGDPNNHSTSATAFEISTSEQLWEVTDCVSNSATIYFELGDDIDVSGSTAPTNSPIGFSTSSIAYSFSGVLDGNQRIISGISMSASAYGVGLFAHIHGATVSNLTITGNFQTSSTTGLERDAAGALGIRASGALALNSISNQATVSGVNNVGGLLGYVANSMHASSITNLGAVSGVTQIGGIAGSVTGTLDLTSSSNEATVSGSSHKVGGLVGISMDVTTVTSTRNTGEISGSDKVAGLVGQVISRFDAHSTFNSGPITGSGDDVGGLAGYVSGVTTISLSGNTAPILSDAGDAGGLIGEAANSVNIEESFNTGAVTGSGDVGGFVGYLGSHLTVTNSYNIGNVYNFQDDTGGLAGYVWGNAYITYASNSGVITGDSDNVGGLAGDVRGNAYITYASNSGVITGARDNVGGLLGSINDLNAYVSSSFNIGPVSGSGENVGGLVGFVDDEALIMTSYNSATVSGIKRVGGLIGRVDDDTRIKTSFNSGAISATGGSHAGGLVGWIRTFNGFIENSYNIGSISGFSTSVGGLVGSVRINVVATSSYNAGTLSGDSTDGLFEVLGTAQISNAYTNVGSTHAATSTPSQMKLASTYAGFDFTNTWGFGSCTDNNGYPMLRVFGLVTSATEPDCSVQSSGGATGAATPAPTYTGPMVTSAATTPIPGKPVVITGKKLSEVTEVTLGGTSLTVSAVTEESMTIQLPEDLEPGSYDLVIFSGQGKLTVMNFITITSQQSSGSEYGELLGYRWTERFTANLRTLSMAQERSIVAALAQFEADTVICWAYTTALIPNDWALAHATARAKSACDFVAETNPGLKTAVRVKYGVSKNAAMRVSLQFWELKNTN